MKKIIRTLLMITCVLGLTACGKSDAISDFQQSKIDQAEMLSGYVIEMMEVMAENDTTEVLANYNNIELADWFAYNFQSYTGASSIECEGKGVRSGITSFVDGLDTIGEIISLGDAESTYDEDEIIVRVPVTGVNGNAEVELIFSNDIYFKMSACTLNVDETFGSLMARAGLNTLIGMMTVFTVLILISLIISCFKFIPNIQNAFKKKDKTQVTNAAPVAASAPVVEEVAEELADDTELVAVIAAAIAAYEGTSADGFQVRSIKRANTKNWKKQ